MNDIHSHWARTKSLMALCKDSSTYDDTRVQGYLTNCLVVMGSAYIEISLREILTEFCAKKGHPFISEFARTSIAHENSISCKKMQTILDKFDAKIWIELQKTLDPGEQAAINSLKTLRDQFAHGRSNGTGYVTVTEYCKLVEDFPEKLKKLDRKRNRIEGLLVCHRTYT